MRTLITLLVAAALSVPASSVAQAITCIEPAEPASRRERCELRTDDAPGERRLVVRVEGDVPVNHPIAFTLTSAGGGITDTVRTGPGGLAQLTWSGIPGGAGTVIRAETVVNRRVVHREIIVVAQARASARQLEALSQPAYYWYEDRQVRGPVELRITNPGERCEDNLVVFRPATGVGALSPDTVRASTLDDDHPGVCTARAWWRLGKGVGRQHMRAFLADEPSKAVAFGAVARALPRIGGGVVVSRDFANYDQLDEERSSMMVTRKFQGSDGGDSVVVTTVPVSTVSYRQREGAWFTTPVITADFPLAARWTGVRASLGVSLLDPDKDWYLGLSALQPIWGVNHEALGVDLHAIMHFGRRSIVRDRACRDDDDGDGTPDYGDCATKEELLFPMGVGFMAMVEGGSLLGTLGSIFN